ncbi:MAG: hypothetical protein GVY10_09225 [Verrucomicrobia bacterium]|nr:hypothetical protein [Verrucomicrobiota bacterium]
MPIPKAIFLRIPSALLIVAALCTPFPQALAQPEDVVPRKLRVCSFLEQALDALYYLTPDGDYEKLRAGRHTRGPVIELPPEYSKLEVFLRGAKNDDGEFSYRQLFSVDFASLLNPLLLLSYNAEGRLVTGLIDDGPERHPKGQVRFLNLFERGIALQFAGENYVFKNKDDRIIEAPEAMMGRHNTFSFRFGTVDESGKWVSPEMSFRLKRPEQRLLVVFTYLRVEQNTGANQASDNQEKLVHFTPRAYLLMDLVR